MCVPVRSTAGIPYSRACAAACWASCRVGATYATGLPVPAAPPLGDQAADQGLAGPGRQLDRDVRGDLPGAVLQPVVGAQHVGLARPQLARGVSAVRQHWVQQLGAGRHQGRSGTLPERHAMQLTTSSQQMRIARRPGRAQPGIEPYRSSGNPARHASDPPHPAQG